MKNNLQMFLIAIAVGVIIFAFMVRGAHANGQVLDSDTLMYIFGFVAVISLILFVTSFVEKKLGIVDIFAARKRALIMIVGVVGFLLFKPEVFGDDVFVALLFLGLLIAHFVSMIVRGRNKKKRIK